MASKPSENCYGLVIDTDSYAGNFERELCAHVTGMTGECEVGREYVKNKLTEEYEDIVMSVPDDHGCHRPATIYPSRNGKGYNSVLIYFREQPTKQQVNEMMERAITFNDSHPKGAPFPPEPFKILGCRMIKFTQTEEEIGMP